MPLDPNLILGVRPPQIQSVDPLERYGKIMALRNMQTQGDVAERGLADEQAVRSAYQQAGGDNARLRALLQQGGQYKPLQALDKFDLEKRTQEANILRDTAAAGKSQYDIDKDKIERTSSMLAVAKDQPSWDMVRRALVLQNPKAAPTLPEVYDPQFIATQIAQGQTITQHLETQNKAQTLTETGRHNLATEGTQFGTLRETGRHNLAAEGTAARTAAAAEGNVAVNTEGKLRDDYNKASQEFVAVRDAHQRVLASAKDPSAAGDLALIFNYMKVLDPRSTVREGEFATAQNSGGVESRIAGMYNKVLNGERLADKVRADFVDRSGRLYTAAETNQKGLEKQYTDISTRSKANPANVVAPQRVVNDASAQNRPMLGAREGGYIYKGGDPASPSSWEKL